MSRQKLVAVLSMIAVVFTTVIVVVFNPATTQAQIPDLPVPVPTVTLTLPGPVETVIERVPVPGPTVTKPGPTVTVTEPGNNVPGPTVTVTETATAPPTGQNTESDATVSPTPEPSPTPDPPTPAEIAEQEEQEAEVLTLPEAIGISTAALVAGILLGLLGVFLAYYSGRKDEEVAQQRNVATFVQDVLRR